jgi:hypothetical protein
VEDFDLLSDLCRATTALRSFVHLNMNPNSERRLCAFFFFFPLHSKTAHIGKKSFKDKYFYFVFPTHVNPPRTRNPPGPR